MKKRLLLIATSMILAISIVGCSDSGAISKSDSPAANVAIDGKNDDDLTGLTYLYDYGDNARLYADNFTKIVYIVYYDSSGSGAKATKAVSMSPWLSENGKYCYVDTENYIIKELSDDEDQTSTDTNTDDDNDNEDTNNNVSSSEETDSSTLDSSVTDKINQNQN